LNVSLDTNIFIDVKNKEPDYEFSKRVLDWIDSGELKCVISTVLVAEMCAGYHSAGELREKEDFLTHIISSQDYEIMQLSTGLADEAGRIRAATELRLPDAIIVASALKGGAECLISNDLSLKKAAEFIKVITAREFVQDQSRMTDGASMDGDSRPRT
jgi:predicted nucleic acid-binding protein